MILLTHPGTQYSYQLARQLFRNSLLNEFWTGFALPRDAWYTRLMEASVPGRWRKKISNRVLDGLPARHVRTMPLVALNAARQGRAGRQQQQLVFHKYNRIFQERIPDAAIRGASAVIGFDTASWVTAERASAFGVPFFLDQSAVHPLFRDSVMSEVIGRFPRWQSNYEPRAPHVLACERHEHKLATKIVAASTFTKRSLVAQGVPAEKVVVNPYGVDLRQFRPAGEPRPERPLRFLFLGAVSALKGVPLLVDAWRSLAAEGHELRIVGPVGEAYRELIPSLPGMSLVGKLPHRQLPELMRQCDVLVFPSYCDGFGLVILEALATGLPVITTDATGGPDLIEDGREGFLIRPGDLEALVRAMRFFVGGRGQLPSMAAAARLRAERYSWDAYGDRWRALLEEGVTC